jgi:hypothetical protein
MSKLSGTHSPRPRINQAIRAASYYCTRCHLHFSVSVLYRYHLFKLFYVNALPSAPPVSPHHHFPVAVTQPISFASSRAAVVTANLPLSMHPSLSAVVVRLPAREIFPAYAVF